MSSTTNRLGLLIPDGSDLASDFPAYLAQDYPALDAAVGMTPVTSGSIPAAPFIGQLRVETDTFRQFVWAGAAWRPVGSIVVAKTSDLSVSASATLVSDAQLTAPLAASARYLLDALLIYSGTAAADAKFALSLPAGATSRLSAQVIPTATGVTSSAVEMAVITTAAFTAGAVGAAVLVAARVQGVITTGVTAGNVVWQFAQAVSDPPASVLYTDSWMRLTGL